MINKTKICVHLDNTCLTKKDMDNFYLTFSSVCFAIERREPIIHTGCTEFISQNFLDNYQIFICSKYKIREMYRLTEFGVENNDIVNKGKIYIEGIEREFRESQNIRSMIFSGAIPLLDDKFYNVK